MYSSQIGAIKSLCRQSVLGKGDLDQELWLCLADDLIAAVVHSFLMAVLSLCAGVVSAHWCWD